MGRLSSKKISYHDLFVHNDTLLLADVFKNFQNKCMRMYEL